MIETKESLKEEVIKLIDMMSEEEIEALYASLNEKEEEEKIAEELIAIRGEIRKMTKIVYALKEESSEKEFKHSVETLTMFHNFLINSKESLETLPNISHFGLSKFREDFASFKKGFHDIELLYENVMKSFFVEPTAHKGVVFDPELHEAVEILTQPGARENEILEVFTQGYTYKKQVVSYAKVKVNKG